MLRAAAIRYHRAPSLTQAAAGHALERGDCGDSVCQLQALLNRALGAHSLVEDGYFGDRTDALVRAFQRGAGLVVDGEVGPETLAALRYGAGGAATATASFDPRPAQLAPNLPPSRAPLAAPRRPTSRPPRNGLMVRPRQRPTRRAALHPASRQPAPPQRHRVPLPSPTAAAGGAELLRRQSLAIASAEHELAAGVHEDAGRPNRSARVDAYARAAGHVLGLEWCGNFVAFNYMKAGMRAGTAGRTQMSSSIRATHFFLYRQYTDMSSSRRAQLDALRARHQSQGSTRQFWTLAGSYGESYLRSHRNMPADFNVADHVARAEELPLRPGDVVMFHLTLNSGRTSHHIGLVRSYDAATGELHTIEGNVSGRVAARTYNVHDRSFVAKLYGFGRPALDDFVG